MARKGILSLGDAFIDFVSQTRDNNSFDRNLGGASVNVAVHISRFAIPSFYITKLGIDEDSIFVEEEMQKEKINLDESVRTSTKKISKVFVHLDEDGERHFHNYEMKLPMKSYWNQILKDNHLKIKLFSILDQVHFFIHMQEQQRKKQ